jgi:hypothetical protein
MMIMMYNESHADLIFSSNYFETITKHFQSDPMIGMVGGFVTSKRMGTGSRKPNR